MERGTKHSFIYICVYYCIYSSVYYVYIIVETFPFLREFIEAILIVTTFLCVSIYTDSNELLMRESPKIVGCEIHVKHRKVAIPL